MFYNYKFLPYLLLFMGALAFTLKGATAIKTRSVEIPIGAGHVLQGDPAVWAGIGFVALGVACVVGLIALFTA